MLVSAINMVRNFMNNVMVVVMWNIGRAHNFFLHLFRFLALSGFLIFLAKIFLILFPVSF